MAKTRKKRTGPKPGNMRILCEELLKKGYSPSFVKDYVSIIDFQNRMLPPELMINPAAFGLEDNPNRLEESFFRSLYDSRRKIRKSVWDIRKAHEE
jgi:hypothetical protein